MKKIYVLILIAVFALLTGCSKSLEEADSFYQKKEYSEAFKIYKKLADDGDVKALNQVAYMYAGGEGVAKDYSEAFKYSKLSADKGNAKGQFNLGIAYLYGFGAVKNNEEALKWFGLAAKQGDVDAQNSYNDLEKHMINVGELTVSAPASAPPLEATFPQRSPSSTPVDSADTGSLKRGGEYSYYATGSCTENCLTKNQAQKLCGEIYSYNQNMFNLLTKGGALSERDSTVLQNTSPSFNVSWNGASCRGRMSASGIYKGTSTRVDIDGAISGFYIKENGQVLANYLDPLR